MSSQDLDRRPFFSALANGQAYRRARRLDNKAIHDVVLPWSEDSEGYTVYERLGPVMKQLNTTTLAKALKPAKSK